MGGAGVRGRGPVQGQGVGWVGFGGTALEGRAVHRALGAVGPSLCCAQLDAGLWEVCLQQYGIYRTSNICGKYLAI